MSPKNKKCIGIVNYLGYLLGDDLASIMLNWISIFLFNIYQHKQKHMNGKTLFKTKTCFAFGVRLGEARGFMEQWFSYITTSNTYIFGTIDWSCRSQLSILDQYWIGRILHQILFQNLCILTLFAWKNLQKIEPQFENFVKWMFLS